jgi:hypothetical protein
MAIPSLLGSYIDETYQRLVQVSGSEFADGLGNPIVFPSGGGSGSNATATFTNQSTWTFNHNLGNRFVIVEVFDTNYNQIIPQEVTLTSANTVTITFPTIESGYAIASLGGASGSGSANIDTGSFATTGSNTFSGSQIITGSLTIQGNIIPGGPYTNNTSSYNLGSPTAAWKDIYVSNGSLIFISGSASSSIKLGTNGTVNLTGSLQGTASFATTASYATTSSNASYATNAGSASVLDLYGITSNTNSYLLFSNIVAATGQIIGGNNNIRYNSSTNVLTVGNISATNLTGSLQGTASWATNFVSASNYVLNSATSSFVTNSQTSSFVLNSQTSSFVTNSQTSSFVINSQTSSFVLNSQTSSMTVATASYIVTAQTASYVTTAQTASYVLQAVSSSFASTASYVQNAQTASYVLTAQTASYIVTAQTASYVLNAVSSSFASTASYVNNLNQTVIITGSLTIGSITGSQTTENTLNVYAPGFNTNGEGGQILLAAMPSASSYTSASMLDNYQDTFRILRGTNAGGSNTSLFTLNLTTGNTLFTGAVTASAYSGLPNAWLHALRSGNQTIGSGTWASRDIIFNNYSSNNFTYDSSTGIATLKAGKTYRITARLAWSAAGLYTLKFGVYNQSTSGFTGPTVEMIQSPNGTFNVSDTTLEHIFNVGASDVNISIRTTSDTNAQTGEAIRGDLNTQLIIQQIA